MVNVPVPEFVSVTGEAVDVLPAVVVGKLTALVERVAPGCGGVVVVVPLPVEEEPPQPARTKQRGSVATASKLRSMRDPIYQNSNAKGDYRTSCWQTGPIRDFPDATSENLAWKKPPGAGRSAFRAWL